MERRSPYRAVKEIIMAAVPRRTAPLEALSPVRSGMNADILRFPRRRALAVVASDLREESTLFRMPSARPDLAAGWAVTLILAVAVLVLL
jgi:hypothetical protein